MIYHSCSYKVSLQTGGGGPYRSGRVSKAASRKDARIVDQHVHALKSCDHCIGQVLHLALLGHVHGHGQGRIRTPSSLHVAGSGGRRRAGPFQGLARVCVCVGGRATYLHGMRFGRAEVCRGVRHYHCTLCCLPAIPITAVLPAWPTGLRKARYVAAVGSQPAAPCLYPAVT